MQPAFNDPEAGTSGDRNHTGALHVAQIVGFENLVWPPEAAAIEGEDACSGSE